MVLGTSVDSNGALDMNRDVLGAADVDTYGAADVVVFGDSVVELSVSGAFCSGVVGIFEVNSVTPF